MLVLSHIRPRARPCSRVDGFDLVGSFQTEHFIGLPQSCLKVAVRWICTDPLNQYMAGGRSQLRSFAVPTPNAASSPAARSPSERKSEAASRSLPFPSRPSIALFCKRPSSVRTTPVALRACWSEVTVAGPGLSGLVRAEWLPDALQCRDQRAHQLVRHSPSRSPSRTSAAVISSESINRRRHQVGAKRVTAPTPY